MLGKVELIFGFNLTRSEKEKAMEIRTINDILDYLDKIWEGRTGSKMPPFLTMKRRVVITACSAITPIGYRKQAITDSLLKGNQGSGHSVMMAF